MVIKSVQMATNIETREFQALLYLATCHGFKISYNQCQGLKRIYERTMNHGVYICFHHHLKPNNQDFYELKFIEDCMGIRCDMSLTKPHACYFNADYKQIYLTVSNIQRDENCYEAEKETHTHPLCYDHLNGCLTVETNTCGLVISRYKVSEYIIYQTTDFYIVLFETE